MFSGVVESGVIDHPSDDSIVVDSWEGLWSPETVVHISLGVVVLEMNAKNVVLNTSEVDQT